MISHVVLYDPASAQAADTESILVRLRAELGPQAFDGEVSPRQPRLRLSLDSWQHPSVDVLSFDRAVHQCELGSDFVLELSAETWQGSGRAALALLIRYQRLLPLMPAVYPVPELVRVLAVHRALHNLVKPLVRADYDHAIDTWRWLLRLNPEATPALQLAALFHDVERVRSEGDQRVEQHASDYHAFKTQHARGSARMATRILLGIGLDHANIRRTAELIAEHEQPELDPELDLLNDADALSFFSLNSWGYLRYFGLAQTRRKVAYTLDRMSQAALWRLGTTRQPPEIATMLGDLLPSISSSQPGAQHA